jgi:NhaP-type Na+/H+ or K+/H+ antiporter
MPMMWVISGLLVYWILNLPFWEAMVIGGAITPTDPIVATSIVTGVVAEENLPERLRHLISADSGANDGLAYPFVLLAISMLKQNSETNSSAIATLSHWFTHVILWEVGVAIIFGAFLGYVAGRILEWAERKKTIERQSFLGYTIALSITVLGAAKLIGTDGVLAVFVAGLAFNYAVKAQERAEEDNVQEAINRFFTLPIFILLGLTIPWQQWGRLGWWSLVLVVSVLLLRRIPALLLCHRLINSTKNIPETLFVGWFGPIGVAAMYYAGYGLRETGIEEVWLVCSLMICSSIVAHGFSSVPFTKLYGKYRDRHRYWN